MLRINEKNEKKLKTHFKLQHSIGIIRGVSNISSDEPWFNIDVVDNNLSIH